MECNKIRELLSEYIDGTLDPEQTQGIRDRLAHCDRCSQEFTALKAVADSMNSLEPVKAPEDFLERVHARIHQRSRFKRVFNALFVPAPIKIPLECAGVLATAVLVALLLGIPQRYLKKIHEGEKLAFHLAKEGKRETAQEQMIRTEKSPHPPVASKPLSRKSPPLSLRAKEETVAGIGAKEELIELVLVLPYDVSEKREACRPDMAQDEGKDHWAADRPSGEQDHLELKPFKKQSTLGEDKSFSDLINNDVSRIRASLERVQGRYISTEYDPRILRPNAIIVEIPAEKYGAFLEELAHIGTLEKPIQSIPPALTEHIQVRIRLLHPH
jgi:hypothetical protein